MNAKITLHTLCLTVSTIALIAMGADKAFAQQDMLINQSLSIGLQQAVSTGIATNPEYGVVAASRRATDEELKQGEALFLPSIDMRADTGWEHTDSPGTRARANDGDDTEDMWRSQASLTLTQMLFDGWQSKYEVARQKARVSSSASRVRETAELVGLSIVESYLEVLRQRQLLEIAGQNVEDHVSILTQIEDGVGAGRSTQADLEQAKSRFSAAKTNQSSTRQALRIAEAQYIRQVGDKPGFLEVPPTPFEALDPDVDSAVEKTLAYSPTLDIFASDIEAAYAESLQTRASFYPQVDFELNGRTGSDLGGVDGRDTSASALVVANWNLYRGGADMARSREFIHRHQQAKENRTVAARDAENDVRTTWASMVSAGERAKEFATQANANTEIVKAYRDQFNLDRRTLLDVLDAQNELFVSRSNVINSEYLEMFAVYRLLALKGNLLPTLSVAYPAESALADGETWSTSEKMKAR